MSDAPQREITLDEWVERLPECHLARKELKSLRAQLVSEAVMEKKAEDMVRLEKQKALLLRANYRYRTEGLELRRRIRMFIDEGDDQRAYYNLAYLCEYLDELDEADAKVMRALLTDEEPTPEPIPGDML